MNKGLKRWISVLLISSLGLLAACGGNSSTSPATDSTGDGNKGESQEKIVLKLAHWLTEESPQGKQYKEFARLVNERSGGKVEIQVFPNSQLGNQRDILEGVIAGTIDMSKGDDAYLSTYVPEYSLFSLPFVFRDYAHLGKVLDSDITKQLDEKLLQQTGMRSLGWSFGGFRYFISKEEITGPDLKGMKLRVPESEVYIETVKLLNGNPTPMPWGDVYSGLETGIVDGLESAPSDLHLQNFYEVTKHLLATNHIQASATTVINDKKWQTIPAEYQELILDALREAIEAERSETEKANDDAVQKMLEAGLTLTKVDDPQPFVEKVKPLWDKVAKQVGGEKILEEIVNMQ